MRKLPAIFTVLLLGMTCMFIPAKADRADGTTFAITKAATPSTAAINTPVAFAITIENISGSNAAPIKIVDTLPDGWTFNNDAKLTNLEGFTADFQPTVSGQDITWTFDGTSIISVPPTDNIVISFTANAPGTVGTYLNKACLEDPETVCANAQVEVQQGTPKTGIVENIAIIGSLSGSLILLSLMISNKRKTFEDKMIRRFEDKD